MIVIGSAADPNSPPDCPRYWRAVACCRSFSHVAASTGGIAELKT